MLEGLNRVTFCKSDLKKKNLFFVSESPTGLRGSHIALYTQSENYSVSICALPHTAHKSTSAGDVCHFFPNKGKVALAGSDSAEESSARKCTVHGARKKEARKQVKTTDPHCHLFYPICKKVSAAPYCVFFTKGSAGLTWQTAHSRGGKGAWEWA